MGENEQGQTMVKCEMCGKMYPKGSTCCRIVNRTVIEEPDRDIYR